MEQSSGKNRPPASFIIGAIALVFLIVGYQSALFIHRASITRIIANHDRPDTVYVYEEKVCEYAGVSHPDSLPSRPARRKESPQYGGKAIQGSEVSRAARAGSSGSSQRNGSDGKVVDNDVNRRIQRKESDHSGAAESIRLANSPRKYESFPFDPNTVSVDDLMRLGFSQKQAQSIDSYRKKGGRFRRREDFAKSYVVADTVYKRLEKFIDIPKLDLNTADSAAFETLPGIGKFFASRMVSYREELGGYSYPEQLMDIWNFDSEKYSKLKDLVTVDPGHIKAFRLWSLSEQELARHPYIGKREAHGIIVFRQNSPKEDWTVENLKKAGILDGDACSKLSRCVISSE